MVGQHIRILKGGRWVHAVDCGDETVLHLVVEAPPPRVRRAYRPEFVAGAEAVEVVTHRERTFPAKEIVRRAYSRASDPALAAMFHDSESFVEWCTTGRLTAPRNYALEVPGITPAPARPAGKANGRAGPSKAPARRALAKAKAAGKGPGRKVARKGATGPRPGGKTKAKGGGGAPRKAPARKTGAAPKRARARPPARKKGRR